MEVIALSCYITSLACYWVVSSIYGTLQSYDGKLQSPVRDVQPSVPSIGGKVINAISRLWAEESGQDVAEYAVMLAVILVIVIGTVRLIGGSANNVFSQVGSSMAPQ